MSRFSRAHIGLDLDNTLISYDLLFAQVAIERGFIPSDFRGAKRELRDRMRLLPQGEIEWQRLQAHVYGPAIGGALATEGALAFVRLARANGALLSIVSHKTAFSNLGTENVNLRDGAYAWLAASGMLGVQGVPEDRLFFEDTRDAKIARIVSLGCTHFVDDLEEVFSDPAFPANVECMLLTDVAGDPSGSFRTFRTFDEIARAFTTD